MARFIRLFFNLFNYNLRITCHHFETPANGMEFPSGISATLQFANKHHLGRKLQFAWLVSSC